MKKGIFPILALCVIFLLPQISLAGEITKEAVLGLVNKSRVEKGSSPLIENGKLSRAAKEKAEDMFKNNYFSHTSSKGISPWYWIEKNDYDYVYAGENLAMDFISPENQHKAWMKSETHKKNILNPKFQETGIAIAKGDLGGHETILVVQLFGSRVDFKGKENKEYVISEDIAESRKPAILGEEKQKIVLASTLNIKKSSGELEKIIEIFKTFSVIVILLAAGIINPFILAYGFLSPYLKKK